MADNDKKIDHIYVPSVDDRKLEETLRFNILISYFDTEYHFGHFYSCERVIDTINTELHSNRSFSGEQTIADFKQLREKCQEEVKYAIYQLGDKTGIPYQHHYDKDKFKFKIVEPKYYYDYFPLTVKRFIPEPHKMLTLRFDLERGLEYQLQYAKEKLKDAQDELMTNDPTQQPNDYRTTRRTLRSIDKAMKVVAFRDLKNRTKKMNWEEVASALNLNVSTAQKRYYSATKLIISGDICKYFPEFR